jgi:DNA repair exonuclease SbcCD nuclease subunit
MMIMDRQRKLESGEIRRPSMCKVHKASAPRRATDANDGEALFTMIRDRKRKLCKLRKEEERLGVQYETMIQRDEERLKERMKEACARVLASWLAGNRAADRAADQAGV